MHVTKPAEPRGSLVPRAGYSSDQSVQDIGEDPQGPLRLHGVRHFGGGSAQLGGFVRLAAERHSSGPARVEEPGVAARQRPGGDGFAEQLHGHARLARLGVRDGVAEHQGVLGEVGSERVGVVAGHVGY